MFLNSIGRFHTSYKSYYEGKSKLSRELSNFYASFMAYLVNIANQCLNSKYSVFSFYIMAFINLILLCGDFEENPGPKTKSNDKHSVCHWNVNSIHSHNFQKIAVLEIFVAMHEFDIICILNVNSSLQADHPSNAKRGGVCIYYKEILSLKVA